MTISFDNIVFDLDSTLVTIEGIDELAALKGVKDQIAPLTALAMAGELSLEATFQKRLAIIQPTFHDLTTIGQLYQDTLTAGAVEIMSLLQQQGKQVFVISGGYNPAVKQVANHLGVPEDHVFANELIFDEHGEYQTIHPDSILWRPQGKTRVIEHLKNHYAGTWVGIGDAMSDYEATVHLDRFVCFAGVAHRPAVVALAHYAVTEPNLMALVPYLSDTARF